MKPLQGLSCKPRRPINWDHITTHPDVDRAALLESVWIKTEGKLRLKEMSFIGRDARKLAKAIKPAIALQELILETYGWPERG